MTQLTEGQRYTLALATALLVVFLAFGLRRGTVSTSAQPSTKPSTASAPVASTTVPPRAGVAVASGRGPVSAATASVSAASDGVDTGSPLPAAPDAATSSAVEIVAVVRTAAAGPLERDDATVAAAFLPSTLAPVQVVAAGEAGSLCSGAHPDRLVVAGEGLETSVRDCILATGATILSHDVAGSVDRSVSTRLGAADALVEAAGAAPTDGPIGIAITGSLRPQADGAKAELEHRGRRVTVVTTTDGDLGSLHRAAAALAAAGVRTVVLAMPVADQRVFLQLEPVVALHADNVVSDVADAFVEEAYLPTADGLVGVTATRAPWFERAHGPSEAQARCDSAYAAKVSGGARSAAERADAYVWCEHVEMVDQGLRSGRPLAEWFGPPAYDSPATSTLAPGADGRIGPRQVARVTWRASCRCWVETAAFVDRSRP